jgi:outer membrane receptor protein involved in Fe transport
MKELAKYLHIFKNNTLVLLGLFLLTGISSSAQGVLYGTIKDKQSKEVLIGANILVKGTTRGAATEIDGTYRIDGIKAGIYDVEVTYIGYKKTVITGIEIEERKNKKLDIELESTVLTIDQEVVIVGERPLVDVDQSKTQSNISSEKIEAAPARQLADMLNTQAGIINSPSGLRIRGGRTYETGFYIDGVSAKDPLAGTGFGVDIGSNSIQELEISTGSVDVEYGNSSSGTINTKTKSGGNKTEASLLYKRDNFGNYDQWESVYNQQIMEFNLGGPANLAEKIIPGKGKMRYYTALRFNLSDTYIRNPAEQIYSSIIDGDFWSPFQDNRWSGLLKLNYDFDPKKRLGFTYLKSLNINQDKNMLRITGNDISYLPGYQFEFHLNPDNASTYTHESNMQSVRWNHTPQNRFSYEAIFSRLYVHLRADANGRKWRPDVVNTEFDPQSITVYPVQYYNPGDSVVFTYAAPGFYNNGGISSLWHDHIVEEYSFKLYAHFYSQDTRNKMSLGADIKHQYLQWIDIYKPWIGAPIELADGTMSRSFRLGESSDIWKVEPLSGAFFITDKYKILGLTANVGARLEYWFPGKFVDNAIDDPDAPIRDEIRASYKKNTYKIGSRRFKMRLLPKISASFPIKENQVLYFNYGHSSVLPHPRYIYSGLDPRFTDQSTLSYLGNPDLNPEMDISYEIGLNSQITSNDALNFNVYWKDKYDFITSSSVLVKDITGREVPRTMRINSDYARNRGVEISYIKRIQKWFNGQISFAYSTVTGQSSSANESINEIISKGNREETREFPLAWDRPIDIKFNSTFTINKQRGLFGIKALNQFRLYMEGNLRSGKRYTPYILVAYEEYSGRPIYEINNDPNARYAELGTPWFWMDMNFIKWWVFGKTEVAWTFEITNIFDNKNAAIINPVTGRAYEYGDPVPTEWRDPRYNDPRDPRSGNIPPDNPSRYMPQRHFLTGIQVKFK